MSLTAVIFVWSYRCGVDDGPNPTSLNRAHGRNGVDNEIVGLIRFRGRVLTKKEACVSRKQWQCKIIAPYLNASAMNETAMAISSQAREITAFAIYMAGVTLFVGGLYSVLGPDWFASLILSGIVVLGSSAIWLILRLRPYRWTAPHPIVIGIVAVTIALHGYECIYAASRPSVGFLLWALIPSATCLMFGSLGRLRTTMVIPAAGALLHDLWNYYAIVVNPTSSTAGIGMIFIPLWNLLILIPLVAFLVHKLVVRRA